ncbi:MAG: amino acid--tRNA ligase-related protein [Bacteriovoracaceae bacterium]|jgi:lysyl-tRNA synthetase class 2
MRLRYQFELTQLIRNYFTEQGFLDVLTPPAVENPGMEVHIHPFQLYSVHQKKTIPYYLHTSPEFCLKELLSREEEKIDKAFSLSYCFRDEPNSPIHRHQFLMLEWYRKSARYEQIMLDTISLIEKVVSDFSKNNYPVRQNMQNLQVVKKTMQEIFNETIGIDILNYLNKDDLRELIRTKFTDVPLPQLNLEWDDLFFLLYLNKVETEINKYPAILIYEFPAPLAALSTLKESDQRVCERFEIYLNGVELCNCFNELTDVKEQKKRFTEQAKAKKDQYGYELPHPKKFYEAMERGLPPSAGIALGVERLLYSILEIENPFFY